ncbi:competence protein ComK [Radiobacillus deserti]|uniref:Competence protein n=1 Tax=Radiobacillus deserti TaxID=2594883 RepID=A0A516KED2_9BACI|nr:competence protein ComK [Radiobacillus deserti]QDP39748.1 competence protein [Radiobacillus deserti]
MLNEYEITPNTCAIVKETVDGAPVCLILEVEDSFYVSSSPSKLVDQGCKFFGSSLKGRQDGTKEVCGITHKAPISMDPSSGMYFFPTTSPQNPNCSWIAHSHIDRLEKTSFQQTIVHFKNGTSIKVDVSYGSMMNQIQRTAQFRYLLDNRVKFFRKNKGDMVAEPFPS